MVFFFFCFLEAMELVGWMDGQVFLSACFVFLSAFHSYFLGWTGLGWTGGDRAQDELAKCK